MLAQAIGWAFYSTGVGVFALDMLRPFGAPCLSCSLGVHSAVVVLILAGNSLLLASLYLFGGRSTIRLLRGCAPAARGRQQGWKQDFCQLLQVPERRCFRPPAARARSRSARGAPAAAATRDWEHEFQYRSYCRSQIRYQIRDPI